MSPLLILTALVVIEMCAVPLAIAEFYQYRDRSGKTHYVDDIGKVPAEYRDQLKVYEEILDHLSDDKKKDLRNKQQQLEEKKQNALEDQLREFQADERKKEITKRRQKWLKTLITPVTVKGNQVLVPVKIAFGPKAITVRLLLDTGAEIVVLHQEIADRLKIRSFKKATATVAGGNSVRVGIAKLSQIEVGPFKRRNLLAAVMKTTSSLHYDGLLGMNFLRDLEYRIDFDKQVIIWQP